MPQHSIATEGIQEAMNSHYSVTLSHEGALAETSDFEVKSSPILDSSAPHQDGGMRHCYKDHPEKQDLSVNPRLLEQSSEHHYALVAKDVDGTIQSEDYSWMPYALRWPWLILIVVYGITLLIAVAAMHAFSVRNSGIADDSGRRALEFSWRFLPTLLAVTYVTMLMIVLDAVKKTEPFARLSQGGGARASTTIFRRSEPWWTTLIDSFPRKANDRYFSLTMLCAACAYILGSLVISPFSSALLAPKTVVLETQTTFHQVQINGSSGIRPELTTLEYFHTVGNILQNVTTSPWISDEFTILPFWPLNAGRPSGSKILGPEEVWQVESYVFQTELICEQLKVAAQPTFFNYTMVFASTNNTMIQTLTTVRLSTNSGCEYGSAYRYQDGRENSDLIFWANISQQNMPWEDFSDSTFPAEGVEFINRLMSNSTKQCEPGEVILILRNVKGPETQSHGQLCRPYFYFAKLPVKVSVRTAVTEVRFDKSLFFRSRGVLPAGMIDVSQFQAQFVENIWSEHLRFSHPETRPTFGGPAVLLAAAHNFDTGKVTEDDNLMMKAAKIKTRAFGEALQASLQNRTDITQSAGQITKEKRRIAVSPAVAGVLEGCLGITVALCIVVLWSSRIDRRPLGLSEDPAFANTIASLLSKHTDTRMLIQKISWLRTQISSSTPPDHVLKLKEGALLSSTSSTPGPQPDGAENLPLPDPNSPWRPKSLSSFAIGALFLSLLSFMVALIVLFRYAQKNRLSSSIFSQVVIGNVQEPLGKITPYSIIPTLLAVLLGLWWGALETQFKTAQPFISQAKQAEVSARGSGLSYQSSYLAWTCIRAGSRRHLLLVLICFGATLSQVLTITVSALFKRELDHKIKITEQVRTLQLRQIAYLGQGRWTQYNPSAVKREVLQDTFEGLTTSWLYGAVLQIALNASEPPWSKDGWSFVPVLTPNGIIGTWENTNSMDTNVIISTTTVEVNTPAIRGRLVCSPIRADLEEQYWLSRENLTDSNVWNTTAITSNWTHGYSLGCGNYPGFSEFANTRYNGKYGTFTMINFQPNSSDPNPCSPTDNMYTSPLPGAVDVACCAGSSELSTDFASVGYWSPIWDLDISGGFGPGEANSTKNFTVKWIYGPTPETFRIKDRGYGILIWPQPPKLAMLTCEPILESVETRVTVEQSTGRVQNYSIREEPSPYIQAWTDNFIDRYRTSEDIYSRNLTFSFGHLFMDALVSAAQLGYLNGCSSSSGDCFEDVEDRAYNIKRPGLNLDFMSYAMLSLARNDPKALLDHATLETTAQKTFATFFQHFASSNVTINGTGNRVFQQPDETLPNDLPVPNGTSPGPARASPMVDPTATMTLSEPVEVLRMSPLATWLSVAILTWLLVTTIMIFFFKGRYFSPLLRGVDTIADVVLMIAGSDTYLELARQRGASGLRADKGFRTRLGWFRTRTGEVRWGIELADQDDVEFLTDDEAKSWGIGSGRSEEG